MRLLPLCLSALASFGLSACGDEAPPSPAAPTPVALVISIELTPQEVTLPALGQTFQLSATAQRSDGTTADLTRELTWSTSDPIVATVDARGLVTARGYGETRVSGSLGEQRRSARVRVPIPDELRVPLTGVVRNQHGAPVPEAGVGLVSGVIDRVGGTDANGFFDLGPSYGLVRLAIGRFGYDTASVTVPDVAAQPHIEVTLQENPSPFIERRLDGQLASGNAIDTYRITTRAGATLDVIAETPTCPTPAGGGGLRLRLTSGGLVLDGVPAVGCGIRLKGIVPQGECVLEVRGTDPLPYVVTLREPR